MQQIFKITQDRYNISSKELSEATGIAASTISGIRRGKTDPSVSTLWRLILEIDARAPGAKAYFCRELSGGFFFRPEQLIESLSPDEISELMLAIAQHLQQKRLERESNPRAKIKVSA